MSGGDVALPLVGLLLAAAVIVVGALVLLAFRSLRAELRESQRTVRELRDQVADLATRAPAPEASSVVTLGRPADYVITTGDNDNEAVSDRAVVSATLGEPLIKVAALSYGVRRALREEKRAHIAYQMRREYRRRRRRGRAAARRAG